MSVGKAPRRPDGNDQDDDQDEARNPAGCRPVLAGNRGRLSPLPATGLQRAGGSPEGPERSGGRRSR